MKEFKFLQKNIQPEMDLIEMVSQEVQRIARSPEYIQLQITEPRGINACIMQGYRAHRDNLPPGQCPYDIGTIEREHWLTGWCNREDRESIPAPENEDELYMEVEDVDTGEFFGIPAAMSYAISFKGRMLYDNSRTVGGRCDYGEYEYWIDNVYSTINHTLVIEVTISVPYNHLIRNRTRHTFHKIRQIIPYETV